MTASCRHRLNSMYRSTLAGLCFVAFGLLTLFGACVVLPPLATFSSCSKRPLRVRALASFGFRLLIHMIEGCGLARIEIRRPDASDLRGCLLVANHPSYLDAVFLMARFPRINCVMKPALRNHPLFFPFARLGGYITGSKNDPRLVVEQCRAGAARDEPVLICPEGTRTTPGKGLAFQRGAAQIALRVGLPLVPVIVHCDPPALTHGQPWYRMPNRRVSLTIAFRPPRPAAFFVRTSSASMPRKAREVTRSLEDYFRNRLAEPPVTDTLAADTAPRVRGSDLLADGIRLYLDVPHDLAWFRGHFPNEPVLPGVAQICWTIALCREYFGLDAEPESIARVKFLRTVRPGARLELELRREAERIAWRLCAGDRLFGSGRLVYARP